jgi:hypothetical protein
MGIVRVPGCEAVEVYTHCPCYQKKDTSHNEHLSGFKAPPKARNPPCHALTASYMGGVTCVGVSDLVFATVIRSVSSAKRNPTTSKTERDMAKIMHATCPNRCNM